MEDSYLASRKALDVPYITYPELLKRRASETPEKAGYVSSTAKTGVPS